MSYDIKPNDDIYSHLKLSVQTPHIED